MKITDLLKEINPHYLADLKSGDHYSMFIHEQNYKILILRGLAITDDGLSYTSRGLVIHQDQEVFYYDREEENLIKSEVGFSNLIDIVTPIYKKNDSIINEYVQEIDKLEDSLFERKASRIFMDIWFDLKKDLSRVERHFLRNQGVLTEFYKLNKKHENFQETAFRDLIEQVGMNQHNVNNQISRLDALYNYYGSIKNDKLNQNLYTLTVLSAIFLPLNLIVGFFGMNTENLFFKDNPFGTQYVLSIIVGSLALSLFGIPLIRFIDHHFLQFFLGRYDIYKKIGKKVEKIESILKME